MEKWNNSHSDMPFFSAWCLENMFSMSEIEDMKSLSKIFIS